MTISMRSRLISTSATLVLAAAVPAQADVTAEEVWARWQELSASFGQTLAPDSENRSGDVLTLGDIAIGMELPEGAVTGMLGELVFTENGDGSVTVTAAPSYTLDITTSTPDGTELVIGMEVSQPGVEIRVTGDGDAQTYDFTAPEARLTSTGVTEDGAPIDLNFSLALAELTGVYAVSADEVPVLDSTLNAGTVLFALSAEIPEEEADFEITFSMSNIESSSSGTLSTIAAGQPNISELLASGFYSAGTLRHGPATYSIDALTPDGRALISGTAETGVIDGKLDKSGISYGGGNTGVTTSVTVPGGMIPPLEIAIAETSGEVTMPLAPADEAAPVALSMRLMNLTASDMIWSMFDPMGALPRDPATLVVELSGMGRWFVDMGDPEAIESLDGPPGELDSLSLDGLRLSVAGAELTGNGAFDIDNSGLAPVPAGTLNLELTGGNKLIDTLVAMGLIPEDQAMGARMMLGLFATPVGDDQLKSTIELKEDGSVLANGQRIR